MAAKDIKNMKQLKADSLYMAKLSEQAERYDEMTEWMEDVAKTGDTEEMTVYERHLLSVAFKNAVDARRSFWRVLSSIEQKEENVDRLPMLKKCRANVESELTRICHRILKLLEGPLIRSATTAEAEVFFYKMKGDYYRYLAEFKTGPDWKDAVDKTMEAYKAGQEIALRELVPTNPIRLGLALSFSFFYYEIMSSPAKSCALARQAFDEAIAELDTLVDESFKDSMLIMKLLRDNVTLWTEGGEVTEEN